MKKFIHLKPFLKDFFLYTGIIFFFFMLPYWRIWSTIGMFFFLFSMILSKKNIFFNLNFESKIFLSCFYGLISLFCITAIFSPLPGNGFELQKRVALFIIPTAILFNKEINLSHIILGLKLFIYSILLLNIITIVKTCIYYFQHLGLPFSNGQEIYKILIIDRPYIGLLNGLATASILFLLRRKKIKPLLATCIIVINIGLVNLITARAAMGIIFMILIMYLVINQKRFKLKNVIVGIITIIIAAAFIFSINENLKERFSEINYYEPRTFIWPQFIEVVSSEDFNIIWGAKGEVEGQALLNKEYYKEYQEGGTWKWVFRDDYLYNTHNQFFSFYLSYGIIGFLLFITLFGILLFKGLKTRNFLLISVAFVFFSTCLVENLIARQVGVYSFSMFLCIGWIIPDLSPKTS